MKAEHYKAGEEIIWSDNNLCALNNKSGIFEHSTEVAEGKFIRVCVVNSFNGSEENVPVNATAYAAYKARRRDYTLICGDKVVGWATIHNDHTQSEDTENEDTENTENENTENAEQNEGEGVGIAVVVIGGEPKSCENECPYNKDGKCTK